MTLSGYLFSKLLDGKNIKYISFVWNRLIRLAPLLIFVIFLVAFQRNLSGSKLIGYAKSIIAGVILPSLPNGGWSITVEFHFYIILPVLLFLTRKSKYSLVLVLLAAVFVRYLLYRELTQIQTLSYYTIVGRIDQFLLGMMAYQFRGLISGRHLFVASTFTLFAIVYWHFDTQGGFYMNPSYPSPSTIWIYLPTLEGVAYALAITWYDNSFKNSTGKVSQFIALIGTYSYSIYLLHFFIVFRLSSAINNHIIDLSNIYLSFVFSAVCFPLMVLIGHISYKYIESPFLKFRSIYIVANEPPTFIAPEIREYP